jgi:hypothetical protein
VCWAINKLHCLVRDAQDLERASARLERERFCCNTVGAFLQNRVLGSFQLWPFTKRQELQRESKRRGGKLLF